MYWNTSVQLTAFSVAFKWTSGTQNIKNCGKMLSRAQILTDLNLLYNLEINFFEHFFLLLTIVCFLFCCFVFNRIVTKKMSFCVRLKK